MQFGGCLDNGEKTRKRAQESQAWFKGAEPRVKCLLSAWRSQQVRPRVSHHGGLTETTLGSQALVRVAPLSARACVITQEQELFFTHSLIQQPLIQHLMCTRRVNAEGVR